MTTGSPLGPSGVAKARIRRIAQWVITGAQVEGNLAVNKGSTEFASGGAAAEAVAGDEGRIVAGLIDDIGVETIVRDAEAAAKNKLAVIFRRTPGKTQPWTEVSPGRVPLLAGINFRSIQQSINGIIRWHEIGKMSFCFGGRRIVFPAQAKVQGQIWTNLPVVLSEHAIIGRPEILGTLERRATR